MAGRIPWVVGVTGASGTPYAAAVLRGLLAAAQPVDLVVSRAARLTLLDETGIAWHDDAESLHAWLTSRLDADLPPAEPAGVDAVRFWSPGDLAAGPSSGSYLTRGMVVAPATTAAVAGIAIGLSKDLLQRAADVTLKERRPLVVVPREMPLPKNMQQLVDFVAGKVLDVLGIEHDLFTRWDGRLGNETVIDETDR
jgi:4-hydroxy-3-polyprenylbenzoate decarboxylase